MSRIAAVAVALFFVPAGASEAPASITNTRIEVQGGVTPSAALDHAGKDAVWIGWSVAAIPKAGDACCFGNNFKRRGCSLADRDNSWGTTDNWVSSQPAELYVLVESQRGAPSRVKIMSPSCPVDGADRRLIWLGPVEGGASLSALSRLLDGDADKVADTALTAIAYHRDKGADAILEKRIFDRSLSSEAREQAIFWAGQARGENGARLLDRVLTSEPSGDLRQNAVFALSQSSVPEAPERIKRVAIEDRDREVRGHAYFSLSQTNAPGAGAWIVERLDAERDDHVREQAVFALSQLDDGTDWLLKVLRSKRDPETIRRALFWLAQSNDPRALTEIEKILDR